MDDLIKKFGKDHLIVLSLGSRGSGKTFNTVGLIEFAMRQGLFDLYLLCIPVFAFEANDSYASIKAFQKAKPRMIEIYSKYSYLITKKLLKNAQKIHKAGARILLFIDDAMLSADAIFGNPDFHSLISISRHVGITTLINFQSLTSGRVLSPFVRAQVNFLCLYKIVSDKLLTTIHEDYLSLSEIPDLREFRKLYLQHVNGGTHRSLLLNCDDGTINWHLHDLRQQMVSKKAATVPKEEPSTSLIRIDHVAPTPDQVAHERQKRAQGPP